MIIMKDLKNDDWSELFAGLLGINDQKISSFGFSVKKLKGLYWEEFVPTIASRQFADYDTMLEQVSLEFVTWVADVASLQLKDIEQYIENNFKNINASHGYNALFDKFDAYISDIYDVIPYEILLAIYNNVAVRNVLDKIFNKEKKFIYDSNNVLLSSLADFYSTDELDTNEIEISDSNSVNIMNVYFNEVYRIKMLSYEDTIALFRQYKNGDTQAAEKLLKANLRLVTSVARRYQNRGLELEDLIQEGNIGLMKAIEKYDPDKGFKFSTYAMWWIKQSISRAIMDMGNRIRIPVHMGERINRYLKFKNELFTELNREPTVEEIAHEMDLSVEKVKEIRTFMREEVSLDTPIDSEGEASLGDFIPDTDSMSPDEFAVTNASASQVRQYMDRLPDRERYVLVKLFGLVDGKTCTLEEVGKILGITRERVRQIKLRAMKKIAGMINYDKRMEELEVRREKSRIYNK